jgi:hypothetical protein
VSGAAIETANAKSAAELRRMLQAACFVLIGGKIDGDVVLACADYFLSRLVCSAPILTQSAIVRNFFLARGMTAPQSPLIGTCCRRARSSLLRKIY